MATIDGFTGFEYGVLSGQGAGLLAASSGLGTTVNIESTIKRTGNYSLKVSPTAAADGRVNYAFSSSSGSVAVVRFYLYVGTLPATSFARIAHLSVGSGAIFQLLIDSADNKIKSGQGSTPNIVATGSVLTTGQWYRIDWLVNTTANPHVHKLQVDGVEFTGTRALATVTLGQFRIGTDIATGPAYTCYYDDVAWSITAADYPLGAGATEAILPDSDGTHNAGVNIMEDNAGTDIGATAAWSLLDELPFGGTTDFVRQFAVGTGNYAEINFANPTNNTNVLAVKAYLAYKGSSATANEGGCIVSKDGFSTSDTVWGNPTTRQDYSETSLFYKSVMMTAPGGGWTSTELNAIKARMGYSNNVASQPQWHNMIVEIAYSTPVVVNIGGRQPVKTTNQAVKRSNIW